MCLRFLKVPIATADKCTDRVGAADFYRKACTHDLWGHQSIAGRHVYTNRMDRTDPCATNVTTSKPVISTLHDIGANEGDTNDLIGPDHTIFESWSLEHIF